jgi:hypothetical protein
MTTAAARVQSDRPNSGCFPTARESDRAPSTAIELDERVRLGGRTLEAGLYRVRIDEARERIVLENDDRTYALTGFFRRARGPASFAMTARVEWSPGGRPELVVRLSRGLEWVA